MKKKFKVKKGKVAVIHRNGKLIQSKEANSKDSVLTGDETIWNVTEKDKSKLTKKEKEKLKNFQ